MTPRWAALPLAFATVTVLAACAQPGAVTPGQPGLQWPGGREFLSTTVTENGAERPLVEDTRIRLSFGEDGRLSASAGCNSMSGLAQLEGTTLVLDGLATTEMGCPGGRNEQDAWLAELLTSRPSLALAGDELTLSGATVTIVLLDREVADPDRPLVGTRWFADAIIDKDSVSSVAHDAPAELVIDRAGTFLATTGCAGGEISGTVAVDGDRITFTVTGEKPCTGEPNPLDEAVRATVTGTRTYELAAGRLTLTAEDGTGLGLTDRAAG